jgi:hypothetical protein
MKNYPRLFYGICVSNHYHCLDVTTQPKEPEEIAANLAIYAANCISIDHFLCLIIISSHSLLIKSKKLEFFAKIHKKSSTNKNLSYEYFDSILLITRIPGQI